MAIVIFDPVLFRQENPQFANVDKYSDVFLHSCFNQATMILSNKENSLVPYDPARNIYERQILLHLLTCHIATLKDKGQVGSVTSASEGSVSASFYIEQKKGVAWFSQTQCGYTYYQMIQKYKCGGVFIKGRKNH